MEIRINRIRLIVTLVVIYVILSYPFNWYAMKNEWSIYNNNPSVERDCSHGGKGACHICRGPLLLFSPLTLPGVWISFAVSATDPHYLEKKNGQGNNDQD